MLCRYCQNEFTPHHANVRYCSDECRELASKQRVIVLGNVRQGDGKNNVVKKCIHCGKEFGYENIRAKYCSVICRRASGKKRSQDKNKQLSLSKSVNKFIICKYCKKDYEVNIKDGRNQIYCSIECRTLARKERKRQGLTAITPEDNVCAYCQKVFDHPNKKAKYCSKECKKLYKNKNKRDKLKIAKDEKIAITVQICLYCKKEFKPFFINGNKQKFCSKSCSTEHIKSNKREKTNQKLVENPIQSKPCFHCGKVFMPINKSNEGQQKFCSEDCQIKNYVNIGINERKKIREQTIKKCLVCDKEFTPKIKVHQKYCSARCRTLFNKKVYSALRRCYNIIDEKKKDHAHNILGYTPRQLQEYIKKHPNWPLVKYEIWHLDHIFPIYAFLEYNIKDIAIICSLDNLQPLSSSENSKKNNNYDKTRFLNWLAEKGIIIVETV